jgi:hypothetical protein
MPGRWSISSMSSWRSGSSSTTCAPGDGALDVVPGSHARVLRAADATNFPRTAFVSCFGQSGSVFVMRPLLVHRSAPLSGSQRRRVSHAVFSPSPPGPDVDWTWSRRNDEVC